MDEPKVGRILDPAIPRPIRSKRCHHFVTYSVEEARIKRLAVFWLQRRSPPPIVGAPGDGRSGGTRTHDPRFWRPMLYQLSYTPSAGAR